MATATTVARAQFINGLRDLANFLGAHFGYPVPDSAEITIFPDGADYTARCASVDRLALILGVAPRDSLGHYSTERAFGPITYRVVAVSDSGELEGDE
jgi:hypothetical protein